MSLARFSREYFISLIILLASLRYNMYKFKGHDSKYLLDKFFVLLLYMRYVCDIYYVYLILNFAVSLHCV